MRSNKSALQMSAMRDEGNDFLSNQNSHKTHHAISQSCQTDRSVGRSITAATLNERVNERIKKKTHSGGGSKNKTMFVVSWPPRDLRYNENLIVLMYLLNLITCVLRFFSSFFCTTKRSKRCLANTTQFIQWAHTHYFEQFTHSIEHVKIINDNSHFLFTAH